jgi:hypothetical protein
MKTFLLTLFFSLSLFATTITHTYVGELSIFGKVADGVMSYNNDGKNYSITVRGGGSGIVGDLTGNKTYTYQSVGVVKNGMLIPQKYINTEKTATFTKTKTYTFDHANNKTYVKEYKKEQKEINTFNMNTFSYDTSYKDVEKTKTKVLDKVYKDDMISIFFNKKHKLLAMQEGQTKFMQALGSKDTQEGVIVKKIATQGNQNISVVEVKMQSLS